MPDIVLVRRLFQGVVSYQIKEVEGKDGPEKTQCFLNSLASCLWGAAPGSGVQAVPQSGEEVSLLSLFHKLA